MSLARAWDLSPSCSNPPSGCSASSQVLMKEHESPFWIHMGSSESFRLGSHLLSGDVCLGIMPLLREDDVEHGVGAAAGLIHVGSSHCAAGRVGQGGVTLCEGHWSGWGRGQGSCQDRVHGGKASLEDKGGLWEKMCTSSGLFLLSPVHLESRKKVR